MNRFEELSTDDLTALYAALAVCPVTRFSCGWIATSRVGDQAVNRYKGYTYHRLGFMVTPLHLVETIYPYLEVTTETPDDMYTNQIAWATQKVRHILLGEAKCNIANILRRRNVHVD